MLFLSEIVRPKWTGGQSGLYRNHFLLKFSYKNWVKEEGEREGFGKKVVVIIFFCFEQSRSNRISNQKTDGLAKLVVFFSAFPLFSLLKYCNSVDISRFGRAFTRKNIC